MTMTPEDAAVLVQAIVAESQRLGLTWTMRLATINTVNPLTGTYDGDDTPIPMIDLIGATSGGRAWVIGIPQGGNYVIAYANTGWVRYLDANTTLTNPAASSGAVGTEVAVASGTWLNEPTYTFDPGQVYALHAAGFHSPSALGQAAQVRIRKGSATTSGTLLWSATVTAASIFAPEYFDFTGYVQNASTSGVQTQLSMSVVRAAGVAGAHSIGGATNMPLMVGVRRIGRIVDNPGLGMVAADISL